MKKLLVIFVALIAVGFALLAFLCNMRTSCPTSVLLNVGEKDVHGPVARVRVTMSSNKLSRVTVYEYDRHGRKIKADYCDGNGQVGGTAMFTYKNKSIIVESRDRASSMYIEYTFDPAKREVTKEVHLLDPHKVGAKPRPGNLVEKVVSKLNSRGNTLQDMSYFVDSGKTQCKNSYVYDSQGNISSASSGNARVTFVCDAHGNVTKRVVYVNGKIVNIDDFAYRYDTKGNWIEKTTTSTRFDKAKAHTMERVTTKREITYR